MAYMFPLCKSTQRDHVKTTLSHKLHQVKSFGNLKLKDFCIISLDDDNTPMQKVAKRPCNSK